MVSNSATTSPDTVVVVEKVPIDVDAHRMRSKALAVSILALIFPICCCLSVPSVVRACNVGRSRKYYLNTIKLAFLSIGMSLLTAGIAYGLLALWYFSRRVLRST